MMPGGRPPGSQLLRSTKASAKSAASRSESGRRRPATRGPELTEQPKQADTGVPVISLEHVTKRYGSVVAVERAHFDITRGEFFSMLGPSGCGKTTMLRMIAGFEDVTSGRIRLDGADVSNVPPYRRNVNTVFQQYALFPHMTVFDNVAFGPRTKGLDREETQSRVSKMLDIVRLGDLASRRPDQLSGGQRQRVALAGRSSTTRARSCSTSRSALSTSSSARPCRSSSSGSSARWALRSSSSRTIRRSAHHVGPHRGDE